MKLDFLGAIQWQQCLGGTGGEWAISVEKTTDDGYIVSGETTSDDGGYIVVGQTNGDMPDHIGGEDTLVVKLNPAGITEWHRCLGGTNYDTHLSCKYIWPPT